jgi:general secretion pathway protein D
VIGGLMEEREEETVNKMPLLGDIPLLGWLFKNRSVEKKKTNLLIFLTPHIVREPDQLEKLTGEKQLQFARLEERYKEGELLRKFREETSEERIKEILSQEGASILSPLQPKWLYRIQLKKRQEVKDAVEVFMSYKEVEYAEPNYLMKMQ